jgi:hypothetical protein
LSQNNQYCFFVQNYNIDPQLKITAGGSEKPGGGSGHTSGDDLETFTTTSSDIEVISRDRFYEASFRPKIFPGIFFILKFWVLHPKSNRYKFI